MSPLVLTLDQVAERLQIKSSWLRAKCEGREIPFTMLGGSYRFTEEHVQAIVRQYEEKPAPRRTPYRPQVSANVTRLEPKLPPRLRKKQQTA